MTPADEKYWQEHKLNFWNLVGRWNKDRCITLSDPNHVPGSGYQNPWELNAYTFRTRKYELISKVVDMENQYPLLLAELEELEKNDATK